MASFYFQFAYNYSTKVTLVNVDGGVTGVLKNAKFYAESFFDFASHKLFLDCFNIGYLG